jgi:hypothetical protein
VDELKTLIASAGQPGAAAAQKRRPE